MTPSAQPPRTVQRVRHLKRRTLILSSLGLASCAVRDDQSLTTRFSTEQISPILAAELAPDEGIAVGMHLAVFDAGGSFWLARRRSQRHKYVFFGADGNQYALPGIPIPSDAIVMETGGATHVYQPFAFKLKAGTYRIRGLMLQLAEPVPQPSFDPVPDLVFQVRPAEASYIGSVGLLSQNRRYSTAAELTAACPPQFHEGNMRHFYCSRRFIPHFGADLRRDELLIRQVFPSLQDRPLVERPAESSGRYWQPYPAVLDPMTSAQTRQMS